MPGLRLAGFGSAGTGGRQTLRFEQSWVRLAPWRGDADVAHLVVAPDGPLPSAAVGDCVDRARTAGYRAVLTSALAPTEQAAFVEHGFVVHERLHLLAYAMGSARNGADLARAGKAGALELPVTRATRRDRPAVLELDDAAFVPFWRLGSDGLRDALAATPVRQFRCTRDARDAAITGYAITGLAGAHGYLQRIAAHPHHQRRGIGRALVADSLTWLWRRGAQRAFVNTQLDNRSALALYTACGFEVLPTGLAVLGRSL